MKNNEKKDAKSRLQYNAPTLDVEMIYCENGIAAGSATVSPLNNSSTVRDEWETSDNVVGGQPW